MEEVGHGNPPVNTLFKYEIKNRSEITIDLGNFKNNDSHIKMIKNSIIYAIILFSKEESTLKKINFITQNNENKEIFNNMFLPMIYNHAKYFNLDFSPVPDFDKKYIFSDVWANNIKKNIEFSINDVTKKVTSLKIDGSDKFMYYKTVSDNPLQIRYMGYQIGRWNSIKKEIIPVNHRENQNFTEFAKDLIKERKDKGDKYHDKEEHYLESILLDKISTGDLNINNIKISKIFDESSVYFQFPVLMKPGESTKKKGNTAKYVDVLAKSGDRPVVMELKVWDKNKNSRGDYMFSAFSQVLSYCNYLSSVFGKADTPKEKKEGLEEIYGLRWNEPIIYIIINDIGKDAIAKKFRGYIEQIKKYIITDIELYFVEFEKDPWEKHRKFEVNNII